MKPARVCIDAGDLDAAEAWYKKGHDLGLKEPNISPGRKDLWEFRTEHALARLAARRGNKAEAQKHVAAAKAVLDHLKTADAGALSAAAGLLPVPDRVCRALYRRLSRQRSPISRRPT